VTVKGSNRDPGTAAEGGDDPPKDEPWETTLKTTMVHVEAAEFRGHRVSLWELLHCRYIPEEGREELLELYRAGELSLEQVRAAVSTMVSRAAAAAAGAGPAEPGSGPGAEPVGTGSGHKAEP
ncbi:EPIPL protein, partial [Copsychus sechellarum]|nr:EPIPL protein [Copsychus sechellarum]